MQVKCFYFTGISLSISLPSLSFTLFTVGVSAADHQGRDRYPYVKGHATHTYKTNNLPAEKQSLDHTNIGRILSSQLCLSANRDEHLKFCLFLVELRKKVTTKVGSTPPSRGIISIPHSLTFHYVWWWCSNWCYLSLQQMYGVYAGGFSGLCSCWPHLCWA